MCFFVKVFTFLTPEEIMETMKKHNEAPHLRIGQKTLAREIITDLHSKESYERALQISEALFKGSIKDLSEKEIEVAFKNVPSYETEKEQSIVELLVEAKITASKREAREFLNNGSISVNGEKVGLEYIVEKKNAIASKYIVIRRGKKKYYLVKFN